MGIKWASTWVITPGALRSIALNSGLDYTRKVINTCMLTAALVALDMIARHPYT
jgi:hypothetical protein